MGSRVLYLAGLGRNGSTIVSNVLGTVPGLFPVGELRSIWSHGFVAGARCGCGVPIPECPIWSGIADDGFAGLDRNAARELAGLHSRIVKLRNQRLLSDGGAPKGVEADLAAYRDALATLYEGIHAHTGCDVIVDSSKSPVYAAVLARIEGMDLRVVHQIRDARASAHSWTRERKHTDMDGAMMPRYHPAKTALLWDAWNAGSETLRRHPYLRLRYEDFTEQPKLETRRILDFAGVGDRDADWTGPNAVAITGHHMVHGNPSRGKTGSIELRRDTEWIDALPTTTGLAVTALTFPWQLRYGYGLRRLQRRR
jgi:hypothetical protein